MHLDVQSIGERVTSGKSLRHVRKNIPSQRLLTSCPTAILFPSDHVEFHELSSLFERLKTKVHTQPLVTGLREDLLHVWATFHRGNNVYVKRSKSSLIVRISAQGH